MTPRVFTEKMGVKWILVFALSACWTCSVRASLGSGSPTAPQNTVEGCSDAEVYLKEDWDTFTSCCEALYPNQTCPIACPCRHGAECSPNNRTCQCMPGWVGARCQRSCRDDGGNKYGPGCARNCRCGADAACEPISGVCECVRPENCTARCPRNRYGAKCRQKCRCKTGECDQVTGACVVSDGSPSICGCLNGGACRAHGKPCRCPAAWTGRFCDAPCPRGYYGDGCSIPCACGVNSTCSRTTGLCECATTGNKYSCPGRCPEGLYGPQCSHQCRCPVGLDCNQWTGDCACPTGGCNGRLIGATTAFRTDAATKPLTTQPTSPPETGSTTGSLPPPTSPTTTAPSPPHTDRRRTTTTAPATPPTAGSAARSTAEGLDGGPLRSGGFHPTAPFWGVVGTIAVLLLVVVVLLLLILKRQVSSTRLTLTRQTKIGRQDNVYETVDELGKVAATEDVSKTLPPLPNMFHRGGSARSSVHGYHHRPVSVHSALPAMDAPLPASVAAMVCDRERGPPARGSTSRRSLMAEWRPHGGRDSPSDPSADSDDPKVRSRGGKAMSCVYSGGITIEDDYADPFDTIAPTGKSTEERPPGYLPMILGQDPSRRSQSPVQRSATPTNLSRESSPVAVRRSDSPVGAQRCDSPMAVQRCDSPMSSQRSSSLMDVPRRTGSPMTVHQSEPNLRLHNTDSNMNFHVAGSTTVERRKGFIGGSPQPRSASQGVDPFYFTLEKGANPGSPRGPDDDYDELEPQSPLNSPATGLPFDGRSASSRTSSERSRVSSHASSRGSLSTNSPTLASPLSLGSSPRDAEMFSVADRRPESPVRPALPQRPVPSSAYASCGPPKRLPPQPDDSTYSRLNRTPSQRMELPTAPRGLADLDASAYGRLQRSYSAKTPARSSPTDGPYGKLPQRSRSAMVKSHQHVAGPAASGCVAGEWVPAEPRPGPLPPRGTKPPNVTEPRKKSRWSIKGKLVKKSPAEEMEFDSPSSTATLPYPGNWEGL